jgi:peptidoglycan biosynthesis protein MviN/MurJ (putative lipid II flippase)
LQAGLTVALILAARNAGLGAGYEAAGAAGALMLALAVSSLVKALLLSRLLDARVTSWRWALVYAAAAAVVVGQLFTYLPEWVELLFGIPAVLGTYALVIWRRGFDENDKVLFRKNVVPDGDASPS